MGEELMIGHISPGKHRFGCDEPGKNQGEKIDKVLGIDHTTRDGFEVILHAQVIEYFTGNPVEYLCKQSQDQVKEDPDKKGQQEGDDLVTGNAAGEDPDADVGGAHQEQTQVSGQDSAMIHFSQVPDCEVIGQGKNQ